MNATQFDLFGATKQQAFDKWVHTPQGRRVADRFIRLAYGMLLRGRKMGAKAIWERIRWNESLRKQDGEQWALNNTWTAYMARFAEDREPRLVGMFEKRELREGCTAKRAVVIPIQERA